MNSKVNTSGLVDSINYKKLVGPYFKVFVNGSTVPLPEWVAKQIKSVEITEVMTDKEPLDMAILTIIDAYENVTDQSNNRFNAKVITGKPGNILDLVITNKNQIRILTQAELDARKKAYSAPTSTTSQVQTHPIYLTTGQVTSTSMVGSFLVQNVTFNNSFINQASGQPYGALGFNITAGDSTTVGTVVSQNGLNISISGLPALPLNTDIDFTLDGVVTQTVTTSITPSKATAQFLFQEGNIVDIEWGYQTDSKLKRKMRLVIQFVEYDAPESSSPEAKIYCIPQVISDLGKLKPSVGVSFKQVVPTASGNVRHHDLSGVQIVQQIAAAGGYASVISTLAGRVNYDDRKPPDYLKTITPDESIHEYLGKLAYELGYHYMVGYNFKTGKDTIFFLSDEDYSKYTSFNFVWKGPNTLLASYHIKSDFSKLHAGSSSTIDPVNGDVAVTPQVEAKRTYLLATGTEVKKSQVTTPITQTVETGLKNIFKRGLTGVAVYTPINQTNAQQVNLDKHVAEREDTIILSGTLVGHPLIAPCVATFSNIGMRYSGRYELRRVKHILDASGYKIEFDAVTNQIADSLVQSEKQRGDKDPSPLVKDVVNLRTGQVIGTTTEMTPSNVPDTGSAQMAANFNKTPQLPGKIDQLAASGSNNKGSP
jgi:hypothetical protein